MADEKDSALAALVRHLDSIEKQMASLEADRAALSRAVDILSDSTQVQLFQGAVRAKSAVAAALDAETRGEWAHLGPTDAVLKLLREQPGKRLRASEIANKLKARNIRTQARHLSSVAATVLRRLAKEGEITQSENDQGTAVFCVENEGTDPVPPGPVPQQ